jgi:hypothetical protein
MSLNGGGDVPFCSSVSIASVRCGLRVVSIRIECSSPKRPPEIGVVALPVLDALSEPDVPEELDDVPEELVDPIDPDVPDDEVVEELLEAANATALPGGG